MDPSTHFGLSLVAERVKATNGIVDVHTCLGGGTTIRALIPKAGYNKTPE